MPLQDSTPVASNYKFYIGDEHELQQQLQQQQSCAGPSGLTRSKTDSEINYCVETSSESLASINYVTKNGQLSLVVILKAIHSITLKDSVCSIRTCRIIFSIINKLISMKIITKHTASMYKGKCDLCLFRFPKLPTIIPVVPALIITILILIIHSQKA